MAKRKPLRLRLYWKWRALLYPSYECTQCVGQDWWQGCYCQYHGGIAPGIGPETWRVWLRKLDDRFFKPKPTKVNVEEDLDL